MANINTMVADRIQQFIGYSPTPLVSQDKDPKFLERWANAYKLATTIPNDRRFNMAVFGYEDEKSQCGTAACLAGHAMLHPWFRRRGLKPHVYYLPNSIDFTQPEFFGMYTWRESPFDPDFCHSVGVGCLTPKGVAKVVKAYMTYHWGAKATKAAIAKAVATYDVEHVHNNAPWGAKYR